MVRLVCGEVGGLGDQCVGLLIGWHVMRLVCAGGGVGVVSEVDIY